jgi:ABC-type sugar transport system permease subunit
MLSRRLLVPLAFIAPALILLLMFFLLPLVRLVTTSFTDWNGIDESAKWVGLDNYANILADKDTWSAFGHNLIWLVFAAFPIAIGLLLAVLLHHRRGVAGNVFRSVFFLPYTLPIVVVGLAWRQIYDPVIGWLNAMLRALGLDALALPWLGNTATALPALATAANWTGFGFCMMLFLAGLSAIDPALYDAARVDGASPRQVFWHVTLPGLANTLNLVIVVVFIATMRAFDIVYVTTKGGPVKSTEVLGTLIFRETFANLQVGYGSAIAVTTSLLVILGAGGYLAIRERRGAAR